MGVKAHYKNDTKSLVVCNFPERPFFSKKILHEMLKRKNDFTICGASNIYDIESRSREELINSYKNSLAYVSILIEPENYFSLIGKKSKKSFKKGSPIY